MWKAEKKNSIFQIDALRSQFVHGSDDNHGKAIARSHVLKTLYSRKIFERFRETLANQKKESTLILSLIVQMYSTLYFFSLCNSSGVPYE